MRIALVCERFSASSGGVERVVRELASELARRGRDVSVVCHTAVDPAPTGVALRTLRVPRLWQPLRVLSFSSAARAAGRDFDVVHGFARTRHQHIYRAGGGSHAAYMEQMYTHPGLRRVLSPRHRVILGIEEAVFRDPAQLVQCNSRMVADDLRRRYDIDPARICVVYNGVDTERFHPRNRESLRHRTRADLAVSGAVALFCGSGFERKGLDRALSGLARAGVHATLLVAGRGDARGFGMRAKQLGVESHVRFLGVRNDVDALCAAADLFVLPTHYDAFSNACLEAMAAGLPVATTRTNGAVELVESGRSGLVCDEDFAPAFELLGEPDALADMGAAARKTAEHYTWAAHTDAVLELYARVAA
jgi:UDP-glucose:(heptosyl)LPS alpha-1,3-glucosyltransferase